ncbi:MAG: hypothetical protein DHS20C14_20240 [Phycisphaeraceae bacterium]|nr:MAG: hypothetical protein DHS20C14_20240 [Phycisphaeraceae bacterium]
MSPDRADAIKALIADLAAVHGSEPADPSADLCPDGCDGAMHELVYSFLLWESSHTKAERAITALRETVVDYNELRISYAEEIEPVLGARYPRAAERCARMHAALNQVYRLENGMTLARLREIPKRDARIYLSELEGVPPFVAARVAAVSLGVHAFPVDDRIAALAADADVAEPGTPHDELTGHFERGLRAGEALPAYLVIEASLDAKPKRSKSKSKAGTSRR